MAHIEKFTIERMNKNRIMILFVCVLGILCLLLFRLAWIQVINADEYRDRAIRQQKGDVPIQAKRGGIYDRNGKALAASAMAYNVWIRPGIISQEYKGSKLEDLAEKISTITSTKKDEILDTLKSKRELIKMVSYLEKDQIDKLKKLEIPGMQVAEASRRLYPLGDFAAQILGSVNDDNQGRSGLELQYDEYLSGVAGRWIRKGDVHGDPIAFGSESYFEAEDGLNVVTTIDEVLQHYLEGALKDGLKKYKAISGQAVVMDPKTGDVLAMASAPSFDPNYPTVPADEKSKNEYKSLNDKAKTEYLSKMWRNPVISDLYEPGSTFKVITVSSALQEEVSTPEERFYCSGGIDVVGTRINCYARTSHGDQNLKDVLANSCNVVMVQLAQRLGADRFYKYLDLYGLNEKTGIDLPAEVYPLIPPNLNLNEVTKATLSFGQGMAVTPMQMCSAISSIGNDGVLMKPRLVKKLTDASGKTVKKFPVQVKKKVLSKKSAEETMEAMEHMVNKSGAVKIPGFRIGGKSGTSEKPINGVYTNDVYASMVCLAPLDDPKLAIVVMFDTPASGHIGLTTAAPVIREFFEKSFPYLGIEPQLTDEERAQMNKTQKVVPTVSGITLKEAKSALAKAGIEYIVVQDPNDDSAIVKGQYPQPGKKIRPIEKAYLYME
ncbi:penicillin-binding transpeptidase domain-containing protein [Eubacteriales bacterium KG127]